NDRLTAVIVPLSLKPQLTKNTQRCPLTQKVNIAVILEEDFPSSSKAQEDMNDRTHPQKLINTDTHQC
ncbi:TPA: hypothetical protein ACWCAJ_005325, partial [Escherichia coli]